MWYILGKFGELERKIQKGKHEQDDIDVDCFIL